MKKTKFEKGITLIALIITIVVLLILAAVTIGAIEDSEIIKHSQNIATIYNNEQNREEDILSYYEAYIEGKEGTWTQEGNVLKRINEDGTTTQLKIGDKIEYNEGVGHTSTVDSNFVLKDMQWRVLGINNEGLLELISTQPTDSKLELSEWLTAVKQLDTLCDDLYGNGNGARNARSLKAEDVNKLANYDPEVSSTTYGVKWQYQYSSDSGYMQYRKITDDGKTWTDWEDITNSTYQSFTEPGKETISKDNYQDKEGRKIIADITNTSYQYTVSSKVTGTTFDEINISDLLTKGLNSENNAASDSNITQWLSSTVVVPSSTHATFSLNVLQRTFN